MLWESFQSISKYQSIFCIFSSKSYLNQKNKNLNQNQYRYPKKQENQIVRQTGRGYEEASLQDQRESWGIPYNYNEELKHINPQDQNVFDWEKFHNENEIVPKPGNGQTLYVQSAESIATAERIAKAERERVLPRRPSTKYLPIKNQ